MQNDPGAIAIRIQRSHGFPNRAPTEGEEAEDQTEDPVEDVIQPPGRIISPLKSS